MTDAGPLRGLTVLDMSQGIAGPSCGGHFAAYGARVIKIEPLSGDWIRQLGTRIDGMSSQALVYNRGKESLSLDLKAPEAKTIMLDLAARADVMIESGRPGVADRLGLGFNAVKARNPGIVYISVSGWGQSGPMREEPMVDTVGQAVSGLMSVTRSRDGAPVKIDATLIDAITGLYAFQAATMALWGRSPDAPARHLDISLLQAAAHIQAPNILEFGFAGKAPGVPNPPAGNYQTQDGWMAITLVNEAQFQAIGRAIGQPELGFDPRFNSFQTRKAHLGELRAILDAAFQTAPTAVWLDALAREGALASRINTYGDWLAETQVKAVEAAPAYALKAGGTVPMVHLPASPPQVTPVPVIGQHSRALLRELGISVKDIETLVASAVVKCGALPEKEPA
jgi:CoA:oxalate CoA-transferase